MSPGLGSSMEASCWVARKIFLSPAIASSNARTLDSRPTTNGVIMYGKMTTSRIGIIGNRRVSDFSLEAIMFGWDLAALFPDATFDRAARQGYLRPAHRAGQVSACFFK